MKRLAAILLTLTMMFALCACDNSGKTTGKSTDSDLTYEEIQQILEEMEQAEAEASGEAEKE